MPDDARPSPSGHASGDRSPDCDLNGGHHMGHAQKAARTTHPVCHCGRSPRHLPRGDCGTGFALAGREKRRRVAGDLLAHAHVRGRARSRTHGHEPGVSVVLRLGGVSRPKPGLKPGHVISAVRGTLGSGDDYSPCHLDVASARVRRRPSPLQPLCPGCVGARRREPCRCRYVPFSHCRKHLGRFPLLVSQLGLWPYPSLSARDEGRSYGSGGIRPVYGVRNGRTRRRRP